MATRDTNATNKYANYAGMTADHEFFQRTLETSIYDSYDLHEYFDEIPLPKHNGKTMVLRTLGKYKTNNQPLIEGVIPDEDEPMKIYEHRVTLGDFGGYTTYTDQMDIYNLDSGWGARLQTEQGNAVGELFQDRAMKILQSSKNRWFAGVTSFTNLAAARTACTAFNLNELSKIRAFLKRAKVKPYDGKNYVLLISPEISAQLMDLKKSNDQFSFVEVMNYQKTDSIIEGEIGRWMGFRFVEKDAIGEVASGVHGCVILGKYKTHKGAKIVKLEGLGKPETILKDISSGGATENPLNQKGSVGWKCTGWGGCIEYAEAVLVYECKATTIGFEWTPDMRDEFVAEYDGQGNKNVTTANVGKGVVQGRKVNGFIVSVNGMDMYFTDGTEDDVAALVAEIKADYKVSKLYKKADFSEEFTDTTITKNVKVYTNPSEVA